jgi:hypothetical protein
MALLALTPSGGDYSAFAGEDFDPLLKWETERVAQIVTREMAKWER